VAPRVKDKRYAITNYHLTKLDPGDKEVEIWDSPLLLRVRRKGIGTYYCRYSDPISKKSKRVKIGNYPPMFLKEARTEANRIRSLSSNGVDPFAKEESGKTFAELCNVYFARHADNLRSGDEIRRVMKTVFLPEWGNREAASITRSDVVSLMDRIADRSGASAANRYLAYLRGALNWLTKRGDLPSNPALGIPSPGGKERPRKRKLSEEEIRKIWAEQGNFADFVRICLLTAQRRGSVASMRWENIDLDAANGALWTIPASDMKKEREHRVPLSKPVVEILSRIERQGPYVFGRDGIQPFSGFSKSRERLHKETDTEGWTIHDLRRTATSIMASKSVPPHVLRKVLDHSANSNDVLSRVYNQYEYSAEARAALDALAEEVDRIVGTNVVKLGELD
jgi:integrase